MPRGSSGLANPSEPKAFYAELYGMSPRAEVLRSKIAELSTLVDSLANLLVKNKVVTASERSRHAWGKICYLTLEATL